MKFSSLFLSLSCSEDGATSIEYALIASLISVMIVFGVALMRTHLEGIFNNIAGSMP